MGLHSIVAVAPAINNRSGIVQTRKIVSVQTKITESSIEQLLPLAEALVGLLGIRPSGDFSIWMFLISRVY